MQPLLSIIIPTYKGAEKLPELLNILTKQVVSGDEIIVVDDCSPDNTAEVAKKLGAVVVRLAKNSGVGRARNEGLNNSTNEILVYFDDDVIPESNYLALVREIFYNSSVNCCQGPHSILPRGKNPDIWQTADAIIWRSTMVGQVKNGDCEVLYSGSFCVRKNFFMKIGGFSEKFLGAGGEEYDISMRLRAHGSILFSPQLVTFHDFKSIFPRLKVLYKRARNYWVIFEKKGSNQMVTLNQEKFRLALTFSLIFLFFASFVEQIFLLGFFLVYGFYLYGDSRLIRDLIRWRRFKILPFVMILRHLQYFIIGLGTLEGIIRNAK